MSDPNKTAWKESIVKIWAPIAAVIGALKVLLFDLPQIYHKVSGAISLAVIGDILKYGGVLIFLGVMASYPFKEHRFISRVIIVLVMIGYLWHERNKENSLAGAALVGWIFFIGIVIDLWKGPIQEEGD